MQIKKGSRRFVFVFKNIVIKIPRLFPWISFVFGILENLHERYWYCADGYTKEKGTWYDDTSSSCNLACIHWADRFGFIVIMDKATTTWIDDIDRDNPEFLQASKFLEERYKGLDIVFDIKPSNIGLLKDGRPVFIDYGFFSCTPQWYLGRKAIKKLS